MCVCVCMYVWIALHVEGANDTFRLTNCVALFGWYSRSIFPSYNIASTSPSVICSSKVLFHVDQIMNKKEGG